MTDVLPWQVDLWRQLAGRAQHAHAYLLHGPAGIGKRLLAEQLMALLLCQRPVEPAPAANARPASCLPHRPIRITTSSSPRKSTRPSGSIRSAIWSVSLPRRRSWVGAR